MPSRQTRISAESGKGMAAMLCIELFCHAEQCVFDPIIRWLRRIRLHSQATVDVDHETESQRSNPDRSGALGDTEDSGRSRTGQNQHESNDNLEPGSRHHGNLVRMKDRERLVDPGRPSTALRVACIESARCQGLSGVPANAGPKRIVQTSGSNEEPVANHFVARLTRVWVCPYFLVVIWDERLSCSFPTTRPFRLTRLPDGIELADPLGTMPPAARCAQRAPAPNARSNRRRAAPSSHPPRRLLLGLCSRIFVTVSRSSSPQRFRTCWTSCPISFRLDRRPHSRRVRCSREDRLLGNPLLSP